MDERKQKKGSTGGTAVGAKPGRMKGNKQKAKYQKPEKKYRKLDGRKGGRRKKRKQKASTGKATERRRQEEGKGRNRS